MNNVKKIVIAIATFTSACSATAADDAINPSWYIQPSLNTAKSDADFGLDRRGFGMGLKFGTPITQDWDIQLGSTYTRARVLGARYQQNLLSVDGVYLFSRDAFRPFVLFGAGAEYDRTNMDGRQHHDRYSPQLSAGLGFQAAFTDRLALQTDVRYVHGFLRDSAFPDRRVNNYYVTAGFNYAFGSASPAAFAAVMPAALPPPPPPPPPTALTAPPLVVAPPAVVHFGKIMMSAIELFAYDSSKLKEQQPKLDNIARILIAHPDVGAIVIAGYTDRIGSVPYNQKLSERRAASVKAYLVKRGVDGGRLTIAGKGEAHPIVTCVNKPRTDLINCLEPNRRVEIEAFEIQLSAERRLP